MVWIFEFKIIEIISCNFNYELQIIKKIYISFGICLAFHKILF